MAAARRPILASAFFCVVFLVLYRTYLAQIWGYEGVNWQNPSTVSLVVALAALVATGGFLPPSITRPSDFCLWIIYVIVIVPSALMALASDWLLPGQRFPTAIGICAIGVLVRVFTAANAGRLLPTPHRLRINFWMLVGVLLAITYAWLIAAIGVNHAYISFLDIYTVRADFKAALAQAPGLAYLLPLSYACLNPALIVWGVLQRKYAMVVLGIAGDLVIYLSSGARLALLSIPLVLWIAVQARRGRPVRPTHLLALLAFLMVFARVMDSATGSLMWTAVFSMRILAIPGVLTVGYLKYFQLNPTLGLESFVPGFEPPGKNPLVLVGEWIFHTPGTNANVNFIGSGFMHAGVLGIIIESAVAVLILRLADDTSAGLPAPFGYSFFVVPAISLANGSALTAILTYGFAASCLLAYAARLDPQLLAQARAWGQTVGQPRGRRQRRPQTTHPSTTPAPDGAPQRGHSMDIRDYLRIARRSWALIVAAGVLLAAAGVGWTATRPETASYASTSAVMMQAPIRSKEVQGGPSGTQLAMDYAQVALSRDTAQKVIKSLGLGLTPEQLKSHLSVEVPVGTSIVEISAVYSDAAMAQKVNQAVLDAVIASATSADAAPPGDTAGPIGTRIIESPSLADNVAAGNKVLRNGLIALVLGLMAGFGLAVARHLLDRTVQDPAEVPELADLPVLGRIGTNPTPETEGAGALRANVSALSRPEDNVVVVTSADGGEGTTTVATTLATALAKAGRRVVLVDANLRRPAVATSLGLEPGPGLASVLTGSADLGSVVQKHASTGLDVVPSGPVPANPSELLHGEAIARVLREVGDRWDMVVVDAAPILPVADTLGLAVLGNFMLVIDRGRSKSDHVAAAVERLDVAHAPLLGLVVNRASETGDRRGTAYASGPAPEAARG